jgi:hypothetical protein
MGLPMGARLRILVLLLLPALGAGPLCAQDLAGWYATTHPRESWGEVLVRFRPAASVLSYQGADYPAFEASLWKRREDTLRKLRDGLFGTYTRAAVVPDRQGSALLWYSRDEGKLRLNRDLSAGADRSLFIGSGAEQRVLKYLVEPPLAEDGPPAGPPLEGIYDYYHSSTGRVLVGFQKTDSAGAAGVAGEAAGGRQYGVVVLSEIPGVGYAVVKQGLYGGSFPNDSYPRVELVQVQGEPWLVWSNPANPKQLRRNRITTFYGNGDIGIGLDQGEARYVENTVFRRVGGAEARIGRYADFVRLPGLYGIRLPGAEAELLAAILPTNLVAEAGGERIPIFKIRSADHDGLSPGDAFGHLGLRSEEGRCILVWYSFALQLKEQLLLYELDGGGSFKLGSLRAGEGEPPRTLLEFRRIQ